jgi:tRNA A-37 threonylcarbamoyl transferase component Bud32
VKSSGSTRVWRGRIGGNVREVSARTSILPGRYGAPRLVGRGGMGEIYVARDHVLGRTVAVKLLLERFAEEPELRERFRREALTAARLSGEPHVVTIFDVGEHDGRPFTVMEYLPGGTLAERARNRPVPPEQAVAWLAEAAVALDAAHAHGVVHRDVKPANMLFDSSDRLQVVDFGIARLVDETRGMTLTGTILGTAGYLAPEQARGEEATAASDRYALGVVAYELMTGGRPFQRSSETAEAIAHINEPVPPASERAVGLPAQVDAVFARALAKSPVHRFPTATAFVEALRAALAGTPPPAPARRRRRSLAPLALAGAVLLAAGGITAAIVAAGADDGSPAAAPGRETVTQEVTVEAGAATEVHTVTEPTVTEPAAVSVEQAAELNDEAFALMQDGNWDEALPLLELAVPALRGTYSDSFPYEAYAEYNLGRTLVGLDRCGEARRHLNRSERLQGPHEAITEALQSCGWSSRGGGDDDDDD